MGFLNAMKKINMASSGDPTEAYKAGLESLGLNFKSQKGANSYYEGTFENKNTKMTIDGGQVMSAGKTNLWGIAATVLKEATGFDLHPDRNWVSHKDRDYEAKERMRNAQMVFNWSIHPDKSASGKLKVGRSKNLGDEIGKKIYASGSPEIIGYLRRSDIQTLLERTNCDEISIEGNTIKAFWAPPMSEYQKHAASPESFTNVTKEVLTFLSILCDEFCK